MDDIDQPTLNESAGEEASTEVSSAEEPKATGEVETPETEPTGEVESGESTETEDAPRKGASSRIRELNAEKKSAEKRAMTAEEEASSLKAKIAELTGSVEPTVPQAPTIPQIEPGQEYSPEQYKQHVLQAADALVTLKVKQNNAVTRIQNETAQVLQAYPQLDPENEAFDKDLSDSITEATINYIQQNPYTASPKAFVGKMMKPYQRSVVKEVGKVTENLAKQVSEAATRPTSVSTKGEKPDSELTIAELEKKYGVIN